MCDHRSIYKEFFGVNEGELLSFSFFRKPIRNTDPLRCISIPDIYRYIVGPYAKKQTEMLRSITGKDQARKYKAENFDFCTFSAQGGLSVAGRCRCLTKDSNTSIEKEGYIPYSLQA